METIEHLIQQPLKRTHQLVVGAENGIIFSMAEQEATAKKYNGKCVIIKNQAHNPMIESAWQETADVIDSWVIHESALP